MTLPSRLLSFYPGLVIASSAALLVNLLLSPSLGRLLGLFFVVYGLPLLTFRLLGRAAPLRPGISYLDDPSYSPWWGGHQAQMLYIAFPQLESLLQLVPGLFSLWLRLWGSRVGRGVYWTPRVEIADRSLMLIGDRVVFGHKVQCFGHVVKRKNGRLLLYVAPIALGHDVFIGAGSRIGPGVFVENGVSVPITSDLFPNQRVSGEVALEEKPSA